MLKKIPILFVIAVVTVFASGCSRKARTAQYLQRAERDFASGEYDRAEVEYSKVLQMDRENPAALGRLGTIYFQQERFPRAFPFLLACSQLATNNLDVRVMLGRLYKAAGKVDAAENQFNYVLGQRPADEEAPILLAEMALSTKEIEATRQKLKRLPVTGAGLAPVEVALATLAFREGDVKGAEASLQRAKTLNPKLSALHTALGNLHLTRNEMKDADAEFRAAADLALPRSERQIQYAEFKIHAGDIDAAKTFLEQITRKTPDFLPAWQGLADIAATQGKYEDSATYTAKLLARDPQNLGATLLRGRLELAKGETAKAIADLERVTSLYPKFPQGHYYLALAYLADSETERAVGSLNEALVSDPHDADAMLALAELKVRKGDFTSAIAMLRKLVRQEPKLVKAQLLLADACRRQGNPGDAVDVYRDLEKQFPESPEAPMLTGLVLVEQGRKEDARKAFERAQKVSTNKIAAAEQLVDLDLADKQYGAALQRVEKLMAQAPSAPEPPLLEAKIYLAENQTNQAESVLLKAVQGQPDFRATYLLLAQLYVTSHQHEKAMANLNQMLAKNPRDITAIMLMGMIQSELKDYPKARDTYEKLLGINPDFNPALNNLAYLYSERFGQIDKAYAMARRAHDLRPYDPSTADTLGWILYQKHQYSQALGLLQESADKLPANAEIQYHLGMVHYMMGEEESARNALQLAVQSGRQFTGKEEAGRCLDLLGLDPQTAAPGSRATLEERIAKQPDDPVALLRLGAVCERSGALDKAVQAYQSVLKLNANNIRALTALGRLYATRLHQTDKAFELAKTAHKLSPDDTDISHLLGSLAYETGDYKWSLSLLEETARKRAGEPQVNYDLALARYSVGRVADARAAMQTAAQGGADFAHATDAQCFLDMLSILDNPAQAAAAQDRVQQVLKRDGQYAPALMVLGAIDEQKGEKSAATQIYEKVLSHYPDFVPAEKRLAILYAREPGNDKRAYDLATKARESLPEDGELAKALGMVVYRQGDYSRAANLLKASDGGKGSDAESMYYLGMAQFQLKELAESRTTLRRALDLNLPAQQASEARRVLGQLN
jgi:putative PEP-CTERM system TPR-repeat lipoprotein